MRTFLLFTRGEGLLSRAIARITDGHWSHVALGFVRDDNSRCYFESLISEGFIGPKDYMDVIDWADEDERRDFTTIYLPLGPASSARVYQRAEVCDERIGYSVLQLVAIWALIRFGIPVPRSPRRWICSEAVATLLYPELDLRGCGRDTFDSVDPNSIYRRTVQILTSCREGVL